MQNHKNTKNSKNPQKHPNPKNPKNPKKELLSVPVAFTLCAVLLAGCSGSPSPSPASSPNASGGSSGQPAASEPAPADPDGSSTANLTLYEGPKTMQTSALAAITVDGNPLFVYEAPANHSHTWNTDPTPDKTPMTYFDFEGSVTLDVAPAGVDVKSATVSPLSRGVTPEIKDNHVVFTITQPGDYTVILNDDPELLTTHIFANPPEVDPPSPDPDNKNLLYIGPGEWNVDTISLKHKQTLYIAGGAVVHGDVYAADMANITVRGRGIIDGGNYAVHTKSEPHVPINFTRCDTFTVEGIILNDSNAWCLNGEQCKNGTIDNVKILSGRCNGDGVTLQSCQDVTVKNSFVRSWDDSLVIKNYTEVSSKNISFENISIWTDLAQSMEIGYETNKGGFANMSISDISFKDITVLADYHKPVISIHNADDADIHDITYENIVVEHFETGNEDAANNNELIDFALSSGPGNWRSKAVKDWGSIHNVTINGVTVLAGKDDVPVRFKGKDDTHQVYDVTLSNINVYGKPIESFDSFTKADNDSFTKNLTIDNTVAAPASRPPAANANAVTGGTVVVVPAPDQTEVAYAEGFAPKVTAPLPSGDNLALAATWVESGHADVYPVDNLHDGDLTTYFEGPGFPTEVTATLAAPAKVAQVVWLLNPAAVWGARDQEIEIFTGQSADSLQSIGKKVRSFDPETGNRIFLDIENPTEISVVKLVVTSNSQNTGGQAAEIMLFSI